MSNVKTTSNRYFTFIGCMFVACLLITNIASQKLIPIGPFVFAGGVLLFPVTYIFGDILTEVYGYARTRQIIWAGFIASGFMSLYFYLTIILPPAPGWKFQREFSTTLGTVPRLVFGSLLGYWAGEFLNSYILAKLKIWSNGKNLWMRTISSTIAGQGVDTTVFVLIAFWNIIPGNILIRTMWSGYLFKIFYEIIATPLTYLIVNWLKKKEGIDIYDKLTNFNPFQIKID